MLAWLRLKKRPVIVNLKTGVEFQGVLWAKRGALVILRNAVMTTDGKHPVKADGEVVIERREIRFYQFADRVSQ